MTEFSAAWYLSIVSQAAKATYIRTQNTQYNFASLVELLQFLLFAHSSRRSFLRTYMDPLSETDADVIQTESPENFVVIFEILPIDKEELT